MVDTTPAPVPASVPAKVEKSLGEKFVELVKLLREHGIHYKS